MEFLSSAITPSEHQPNHSHVVGIDPNVLPNMSELSVVNSVAVSLAAAGVNGNLTNQLAAFSNGIVSPDTSSTAASNPSESQLTGN